MKPLHKPRTSLINITILVLAVFSATWIWTELAFPPSFMLFLVGMMVISLFFLFFANLGVAVFRSERRLVYVALDLLIVVVLGGFLSLQKFVDGPERRWFLHSGMQTYGLMVDKITENKAMLNSKWRPLKDLVGRSDVHGKTNTDGSVAVSFRLRSNYSRGHGYLYYSGTEMIAQTEDTNRYFLPDTEMYYRRITNNWFQF